MERETAIRILEIVQEATLNERLDLTTSALAEKAFTDYCVDEDLQQFVATVLDLILAEHRGVAE